MQKGAGPAWEPVDRWDTLPRDQVNDLPETEWAMWLAGIDDEIERAGRMHVFEVVDNQQIGNVSRDFASNGAPNYADVEKGAGGKPASAWTPNPASPGEGNDVNYASMPAPPEGFGTNPTNDLASVGGGAATSEGRNPSTSSNRMAATIKDGKITLVSGKSPATVSAGS